MRLKYLALLLGLGALSFAITFTRFSPRFVLWRGLDIPPAQRLPELQRAAFVLEQQAHPFDRIVQPGSRGAEWRLLFPVIGHFLRLPRTLIFFTPQLGCILALSYIGHLILGRGGSRFEAVSVAILIATGSWFFVSNGWLGYEDSWCVVCLLAVAFADRLIAVGLACFLAPWIDERFVFGLPLAFLVRLLDRRMFETQMRREILRNALLITGILFPYLLVRLVSLKADAVSAEYVRQQLDSIKSARTPISRIIDGIWSGLRLGWVYVAAMVWLACSRNRPLASTLLIAVTIVTLFATALIADDFSRNTTIFVPAILLGVVLSMQAHPAMARKALPVCAAINLILPAAIVVTLFRQPVDSLYEEVQRFENPPSVVNAAYYYQTGYDLFKQGRSEEAQFNFDIASRLDPNLPPVKIIQSPTPSSP